MSQQEFVNCYGAAPRLASEWNIPYLIAENIVKGVLRGGECPVHGKGPGEMVVRDIREDIAEALLKYPLDILIPWGFSDVEIDWNGLIEYGRRLVPSA